MLYLYVHDPECRGYREYGLADVQVPSIAFFLSALSKLWVHQWLRSAIKLFDRIGHRSDGAGCGTLHVMCRMLPPQLCGVFCIHNGAEPKTWIGAGTVAASPFEMSVTGPFIIDGFGRPKPKFLWGVGVSQKYDPFARYQQPVLLGAFEVGMTVDRAVVLAAGAVKLNPNPGTSRGCAACRSPQQTAPRRRLHT